jgi:putative hemolysin
MNTPFSVHPGPHAGLFGRAAAMAAAVMDPLLGLTALDRLYAGLRDGEFIDRALERLGITVTVADDHLRRVPAAGPVIVVANHPTGALDGLALAHALLRRRSDVRLIGNHLLARVPEMRDRIIAVDPFDVRSMVNRRGVRAARAWLAQGGLLVVFPAGEVSNITRGDGELVDSGWKRGVLSLAEWTAASVVPAYIDARSSRWFRLAGLLHPRLRTALLPRELLRLRNRSVGVRFSTAIDTAALNSIVDGGARLAYLRARTYALETISRTRHAAAAAPMAPSADSAALRRDVAQLGPAHQLLASGDYSVFCAPAQLLPNVLMEIGRLREVTFRAAGEGTGRRIDLDRFDREYQHLFVWHRSRGEIAGAYRIGATDRVCGANGVAGLYTHSLFAIDTALARSLGPALELGRSFVRPEYQRQSITLLLLWRGIGALVAREPRYRRLFGAVSISADYSTSARSLMAAYLAAARRDAAPQFQTRARRAWIGDPHLAPLVENTGMSFGDLDRVVRELDGDRGVPILLKQYWKLGATVMGLTVDPAFNHSLDALMMVDLAAVPAPSLRRYLGPEGAEAFQRFHRGEVIIAGCTDLP